MHEFNDYMPLAHVEAKLASIEAEIKEIRKFIVYCTDARDSNPLPKLQKL